MSFKIACWREKGILYFGGAFRPEEAAPKNAEIPKKWERCLQWQDEV